MPHSHHSHSGQFCRHAKGTLEDVLKAAINQKFRVFGISEHVPRYRKVDLYPEEDGLEIEELSDTFEKYFDEAHRLKKAYSQEISILVGLETEFITQLDLEHLSSAIQRHGCVIDYLVGSIHHVNGIPIDFDRVTYDRAVASFASASNSSSTPDILDRFYEAYFDAQVELMEKFHPEIIGHFDLCRLYEPSIQFRSRPNIWSKIERNVTFGISYGALFELNAAAFRKGWRTPYPGEDIFELIRHKGGRFALSDDSHGPLVVGQNYDRLFRFLREVGLQEIWYLKQSDRENVGGRRVEAIKMTGDEWLNDEFWNFAAGTSE
ncbi:histidinol phosphate phosphatase H [Sistotremastrum suecicum HHB10207 ss-3]|uniref:Histidinol-phosphatase n=1 Tax=Sistotremastrum suecicum HHB10207 ss-3 TaxID=1314776 RepID=A0A166H3U1_9AGAM|nr:histidinol phosphate phosphatase H [Sistotremastrum suecicum HHB10207 ss-3]